MKIFLNERSIPERSTNPNDVYAALSSLVHLAAAVRKISNNQQIRRHRYLKDKEVLVGKSLFDYIVGLGKDPDPNIRKLKILFLQLFAKAPFLEFVHKDGEQVTDVAGNCLKDSCFDDASSCRTGAAVISASVANEVAERYFYTISSVFGPRKILNIYDISELEKMSWVYKSNEKHDIPKDVIVAGEVHSAMQLTDDQAQNLLSNGVMIGRCIFNKINNQWYKFHCHEKNIYHGFPIDVKTPYKEFSAARILFEEIIINEDGQLLEELLDIRKR